MICRVADSKSTAMQYLQFHKCVLLSLLALMNTGNMNYLLVKSSKQINLAWQQNLDICFDDQRFAEFQTHALINNASLL